MKEFNCLDLKKYLNHRLIYGVTPKNKKEFGLDNSYLRKEKININNVSKIENIPIKINFGKYDNVVCEGQVVEINKRIKKIHIVGFAYCGDTNEYVSVVYKDGKEEKVKVPFIDWSRKPRDEFYFVSMYGNKIKSKRLAYCEGEEKHAVYLHCFSTTLDDTKFVDEIKLPDNLFTHIFAITLEI